jgi:ketosteroid isomerase-like protein
MSIELPPSVAEHIAAVNAGDLAAIMRTFSDGAFVNDAHREFRGVHEIRGWVEREIVGAHVQMDPVEVATYHDLLVVRARYDGDYDKTGLPPELTLTNYFVLRGDIIDALMIIHNEDAQ